MSESRSKIFHIEPDGQRREFWQMKVVTRTRWFWNDDITKEATILETGCCQSTVWKNDDFTLKNWKKYLKCNLQIEDFYVKSYTI